MRNTLVATLGVASLALAAAAGANKIAKQTTLVDLSKIRDTNLFDNKNTDVLSVYTNQWGGAEARVRLNGFRSTVGQDFGSAKDWSSYNIIHFVLRNKESRTVNLKLIVQMRSDLQDLGDAFMTTFQLKPNETLRICGYLKEDDPWPLRLEHLFPVMSNTYRPLYTGDKTRDLKRVYAWRINNEDSTATTLEITDARLMRQSLNPTGIVDKWGQYTDRSWPNKITSDSQFASRHAAELTDLDAYPGTGEQLGTTTVVNPSPTLGKWKIVTAHNGRKFLQHPNGKLFWVFGMNTITDQQPTPVEGREHYFKSLQSTTGRFASAWGDYKTKDGTLLSYSHRTQNLMLKYGDSYMSPWLSIVRKRLSSWGINTVGQDTVPELRDNKLPYTFVIRTNDFSTRLSVPKNIWGPLPDPYASGYQSFIYKRFVGELADHKTKTNFMGVFVDNELSWGDTSSLASRYNVALGALVAPSTQPAKVAFANQLKSKYSNSISSLNKAWGSSYSSWDAFMSNRTWKPSNYSSSMQTDFKNFITNFAKKYFGSVRSALGNAGLKSLYMGCRYAHYTPEIVNAAAGFVDIHSFNAYRFNEKIEWSYFNSLSRPVLFSELGYSVVGWGTMGGIGEVISQAERAGKMKATMNSAILQPNVVGVLWYCYQDQPVTGRYSDYENAGLGVVDIADNPYQDVVKFFRSFTKTMYSTRGGGGTGSAGVDP